MTILEQIQQRAKNTPQRLIFPEGEDLRILKAANILAQENIAIPILVGLKENIVQMSKNNNLSTELEIINPQKSPFQHELADLYYEKLDPTGFLWKKHANDLWSPSPSLL